MVKIKDKENPKSRIRKIIYYIQGKSHKAIRFFSRIFTARREWYDIFIVPKGKKKNSNQEFSAQEDYNLELRKRLRVAQMSKS